MVILPLKGNLHHIGAVTGKCISAVVQMPEIAGIRNHFISSNILLLLQDISRIGFCIVFLMLISKANAVPARKMALIHDSILKLL